MWHPVKITIKNLMSHLDTEYEFLNNKCVMIYGENLTDEGLDSNGAGKSVILEAITLAITGEVSRDVDREEFINEDSDFTNVELHLKNPNGTINDLIINRNIHRTKSAKVILHENGIHNKELTSVNECNARIYELIGLNKFDLMNFFLIGQEKKFSFLTANDTDKKDIISRFSNTEFISDKIEVLKANSKTNLSDLNELDKKLGALDSKLELLDEQISNGKIDLKQKIKEATEYLEDSNDRIEKAIDRQKKENLKIDSDIKKLEIFIKESETSEGESEEISKSLETVNKKLKERRKELSESEHLKEHLQSVLDGKVTCPKCENEFSLGEDIELSEIPLMMESCEETMEVCEKEIEILKAKQKKLSKKEDEIEELIEECKSSKLSLKRKNRELEENNTSIKKNEEKIKENLKEIKNIKNKKSDNSELIKKKEQKDSIESEIAEIKKYKEPIQTLYENNEFWVHHFGKKGFMTFLTNKSIKSIEGITNSYLKRMKTDLQVEVDGYTVLKTGLNSDKINVSIVRNGRKIAKFNRYSGGEKGRIIIANILGLQKLINMSCPNGGLNFLGLDEVFEGLDVSGQIEVTKILDEIEMTTLVVSHMSKPLGVKNELFIKKINGLSVIEKK